eukprot:1277691-Lingulodinium_polyedra.AAC.2
MQHGTTQCNATVNQHTLNRAAAGSGPSTLPTSRPDTKRQKKRGVHNSRLHLDLPSRLYMKLARVCVDSHPLAAPFPITLHCYATQRGITPPAVL